ncbi:MAG: hypothetical protein ACKVOK_08405 [Flavobacteriales bacterium]
MRKTRILIASIVLAILATILLLILNHKKQWSWIENYKPTSEEPYGTAVLYRLMKSVRNSQEFIMLQDTTYKELPADPTQEVDNYIYIGQEYFANLEDTRQIFDFVESGNNAYIFCSRPSNYVADSILKLPGEEIDPFEIYQQMIEEEGYYDEDNMVPTPENPEVVKKFYGITDSTINLKLKDSLGHAIPEPAIVRMQDFEVYRSYWKFYNDNLITQEGNKVDYLGYFDEEYPNFVRCQYGKGHFYFHSTPLVFTNYYMLNDTSMNYCRSVLSSMGYGKVFWDEDNREFDIVNNPQAEDEENDPTKPQEGPMEFILSEPSLRWAWYILLTGSILYLVFGARRKQKIIPLADNMENTSMEYTEVISQMFMNQSDHKKLVSMKMDLFRAFLRDRFNIKLPLRFQDEDDKLYMHISQKCKVPEDLVISIFEQNKYLSSVVVVETPEMLKFHQKLERFYETCK